MSTNGELPIINNCCFCIASHRRPSAQLQAAVICGIAVDTHRVTGCTPLCNAGPNVCATHKSPARAAHC